MTDKLYESKPLENIENRWYNAGFFQITGWGLAWVGLGLGIGFTLKGCGEKHYYENISITEQQRISSIEKLAKEGHLNQFSPEQIKELISSNYQK